MPTSLSPEKVAAAEALAAVLEPGKRVCLTTHVNPDGDGLLPAAVNKVHPRFKTPWITSIVTGIAVAIPAAILPLRDAAKLVSIGTLLAFIIVSIGIMVLRVREPDLPRPFKTPLVWITAPAGALSAAYLMFYLDIETWIRLVVWLAIGLAIYFLYGRHHARVAS